MDINGNLNLGNNMLQRARFEVEDDFPLDPQPGRMLLRSADRTLYVCVAIDEGLPVWVPMTQIKQMYRHPQNGTALEWTVQHDLNANPVLIQVFDADGRVVVPQEIICNDNNKATVVFNSPTAGTAIAMVGLAYGNPAPNIAFEADFVNSTEWVVNHNLGYNPNIAVYVNNVQVQPASIEHISTTQAKVTFATARSGTVRCS